MNNSAVQLPRRRPFRNEFLYVSVVENRKTASKKQKRFPENALGPAREHHKTLMAVLQPENDKTSRYQSAAGAQLKPFYKLSQE